MNRAQWMEVGPTENSAAIGIGLHTGTGEFAALVICECGAEFAAPLPEGMPLSAKALRSQPMYRMLMLIAVGHPCGSQN